MLITSGPSNGTWTVWLHLRGSNDQEACVELWSPGDQRAPLDDRLASQADRRSVLA